MRQTHTYAILEVSSSTYDEIETLLKLVGYGHSIIKNDGKHVIDMHGIALRKQGLNGPVISGKSSVPWPQEGYHSKLAAFDTDKYEYAVTEGERKGSTNYPDEDDWQHLDYRRNEFTDDSLFRRLKTEAKSDGNSD